MRFIALALILGSLPLFLNLLRQNPHRRSWGMAAMICMLFFGTSLRISASIIGWPLWSGVSRGLDLSPVDMLALALILTRPRRIGRLPFWGLLGFYGATLAFSVLMSTVPMGSMFIVWQFARIMLLFAAVAGEVDREDMRRGVYAGLSLGLMLEAGFVAYEKATGVVQAGGTIGHQNTLGMMMELAVLPLLAALLAGDRRRIVLLGIGAGLIVIAGGGSRGTMGIGGGGLVVLILLSLIRQTTPHKWNILGLGVVALAVAVPLSLMTLNERFAGGSYVTKEDERAAYERAARAIAADYPLGIGANMYVSVANIQGYAQRAGVAWTQANRAAPVHNAYLLARAETGWQGEFALILLLAVPLVRGLRFSFAHRRSMGGDVVLGSTVALGTNMIHNTVEFGVHSYPVQALLIMNLGLIGAQFAAAKRAKLRKPPAGAAPARPVPSRGGLAATRELGDRPGRWAR